MDMINQKRKENLSECCESDVSNLCPIAQRLPPLIDQALMLIMEPYMNYWACLLLYTVCPVMCVRVSVCERV